MTQRFAASAVALALLLPAGAYAKGVPVVTLTPTPTLTATIGFNNVGSSLGTTGGSYTEGSYIFTTASGAFNYTSYGAGGPSAVQVLGPLAVGFDPSITNILSFGRTDGGLFTFDNFQSVRGIDQGANTIAITGFLAGVQIGSATLTSTYDGYFQPIATGLRQSFDRVTINYSTTSSSATLDQLVVTSTPAVPEPATWAMMILGMGAVGYAMRRRQNLATRVSRAA